MTSLLFDFSVWFLLEIDDEFSSWNAVTYWNRDLEGVRVCVWCVVCGVWCVCVCVCVAMCMCVKNERDRSQSDPDARWGRHANATGSHLKRNSGSLSWGEEAVKKSTSDQVRYHRESRSETPCPLASLHCGQTPRSPVQEPRDYTKPLSFLVRKNMNPISGCVHRMCRKKLPVTALKINQTRKFKCQGLQHLVE